MTLRGGWRSILVLVLLPLVGASAASCGGCDKKSCMLPGVYVSVDTIVTADSAVVCVDTQCDTVKVEVLNDGVGHTSRFVRDERDLPANQEVQLSISVYSAARTQLATVETTVRVPTGGNCNCMQLTYEWRDGGFRRQT